MKHFLILSILFMTVANLYLVLKIRGRKTPVNHSTAIRPYSVIPPITVEPEAPKQVIPEFIQVPKYHTSEDSVLGDIISHSRQPPFGNSSGRSTNAHETSHGVHSEIRNEYARKLGKKVNAFYCLDGRAVVIEEPDMKKRQVVGFVPQSLRSYRFGTYLTGANEWDDEPLYLCDEWQAYLNGGSCGVFDVQHGRYRDGKTDGVSGCLEFSIYATALAMAIEKHDHDYWEKNKQFHDYIHFTLQESYRIYMIGSKMEQFSWDKQDALLERLRTSPDAAEMREFLKKHFDGVWL